MSPRGEVNFRETNVRGGGEVTISVVVSLAPDGELQLELPGVEGTSRIIPLKETSVVKPSATIRRVLQSIAQSQTAIGLDGAPTKAQVWHWERHQTFPDIRCAFCQAEATVGRAAKPHIFDARYARRDLGGGVEVRRVKVGTRGELRPKGAVETISCSSVNVPF